MLKSPNTTTLRRTLEIKLSNVELVDDLKRMTVSQKIESFLKYCDFYKMDGHTEEYAEESMLKSVRRPWLKCLSIIPLRRLSKRLKTFSMRIRRSYIQ
jgi:hypothetical protein